MTLGKRLIKPEKWKEAWDVCVMRMHQEVGNLGAPDLTRSPHPSVAWKPQRAMEVTQAVDQQ